MRTPQHLKRDPLDPNATKNVESDGADPLRTQVRDFGPPEFEAAPPAIPGYEVLGELGRGGIGVVYMARQVALNRVVALKLIGGTASTTALIRFRQEAEAVARLQHPNIIQVFEVGSYSAGPYLALEYVDGGTLRDKVAGVPHPPPDAARMVETLARAVHHAHDRRLIHRDLKPHNVLLTAGGVPKIADFGLARSLDAGAGGISMTADFVGTPAYAAPEQAAPRFGPVGPATDVYALGVILYELLVGRVPFEAGSIPELLRDVTEAEPVPPKRLRPEVPRDLETICLKCLRKEPAKRYASAAALADDLHRYLAGEPIHARPVGAAERAARWCLRNPAVAALLTAVFALLTTVAVVATAAAVRIDDARGRADLNAGAARQAAEDETRAKRNAEGALETAQQALRERDEQLLQSHLSEAKASRYSRRVGQRFGTLEAVRKGALLARALNAPPEVLDELRNLAIAALALPDLAPDTAWASAPTDPDNVWTGPIVAPNYRAAAYFHQSGAISVRRIGTGPDDCGEVARIPSYGGEVEVSWSPDGRFLAAYYWHESVRRVRVWRVAAGSPDPAGAVVKVIDVPAKADGYAFAPDSRTVFVAEREPGKAGESERSVGRTYDLEAGRSVARCALAPAVPTALAFHPTRSEVAIAYAGDVAVIDPRTGATVRSLAAGIGHPLAWHPHGDVLVGATGGGVEFWDVARRRQLLVADHQGGGVRGNLNAAGDLLVTSGWSNRLRLWHPLTGQKVFEVAGAGAFVAGDRLSARFPGAGTRTAGPLTRVEAGREYRSVAVGRAVAPGGRVPPPAHALTGCDVHPGGRLLAVSTDLGFSLIDLVTATERAFVAGSVCTDVRFQPDGALLVKTKAGLFRWPVAAAPADPTRLRIGPPEQLRATSGGSFGCSATGLLVDPVIGQGRAVAWPAAHPLDAVSFPHEDCRQAAVSPNGKVVVTGSWMGRGLKVWDATTGRELRPPLIPELEHTIPGFSPDGKWLVEESRRLRWRVADWRAGPAPPDGASGARLSPDGRYAAFAAKGFVILTDAETGRELARFEDPNQDGFTRLAFTPDGTLLAGITDDSTCARIWDLRKVRAGLAALDLDWAAPPFAPGASPAPGAAPLAVAVVGGGAMPGANRTPQANRDRALEALWLDPLDPEARLGLGEALLALGRVREAEGQLSAALALRPDQIGGYRLRADARLRLGDWQGCAADADRVLARSCNESRVRWYRGAALECLQRPADALPDLIAAVEGEPDNPVMVFWRGEAYWLTGNGEEAAGDFRRAAQLVRPTANPATLNRIAWRLVAGPPAARDPKRGLELARLVNDKIPWALDAMTTLGLAQYRNGRFEDAVPVLKRSLSFDLTGRFGGPNLYVLAMCQARLGDGPAARDTLRRADEWVSRQARLNAAARADLRALRAEAEEVLRAAGLAAETAPPPRPR